MENSASLVALLGEGGYHRRMFFSASKILWFLTNPGNLLLIILCLGVAFLWVGWRKTGRWLVTLSAVAGVTLAVVPVGHWLQRGLEDRFPQAVSLPEKIDGIIIAGGAVDPVMTKDRGQISIGGAVERITEGAALSRRYPQAKVIYTGGSGSLFFQEWKEARAVEPLFRQLGIAPGRIIYEDQSRNTYENAIFSKTIAKPKDGETWLLVTSAFHMPRAVGCFRQAGWNVIPYPVDYGTRKDLTPPFYFNFAGGVGSFSGVVHEYLGLLFYWFGGKTDELFPGPKS